MDTITIRLLFILSYSVFYSFGNTVLDQEISTSRTLTLTHSPYVAKTDVIIPEDITLTVDPGVQIRFDPQVTMKVKGTLTARGTSTQRIVFTKNKGPDHSDGSFVVPKKSRLVDGLEIRQGNLHVKYKDHWVGVCSRNREWSRNDSGVACRELGFADGNFTLLDVAENYTQHILYEQPNCTGAEASILDCPGNGKISLGSDICHFQEVVGLQCWGINEPVYGTFWKGLEFYNSTLIERNLLTDNTKMNVSSSELTYVDIQFAGVNRSRHHVGAISASPYPPILTQVRLRWNAYDALNYTRIKGPAIINDSVIHHNRGHGMNISTAVGYVILKDVHSHENGGHGGDIHMLDYRWLEQETEMAHHSFRMCVAGAVLGSPQFPMLINAQLFESTYNDKGQCTGDIRIGQRTDQKLTLTMLQAERDPDSNATVIIKDKRTKKELVVWPVNTTPTHLYQGVTSENPEGLDIIINWTKPRAYDRCNIFEPCFRIIMQASVGETKNPEVLVMRSNFSANVQRGLTVKSPWTYVKVVDSHFERNEFDAGLKIVNGSADVFVNKTRFVSNKRAGLNVTTAGGVRIVNATEFRSNRGHALDIRNQLWMRSRYNAPNLTLTSIVHESDFIDNWYSMRFYNVCDTRQLVLVNVTRVRGSLRGGIEMVSCLNWGHGSVSNISNIKRTNFTVGFSTFERNAKYVIRVTPMLNMEGGIWNSTFQHNGGSTITGRANATVTGGGGVIYIHNTKNFMERRLYTLFPVSYQILYNEFTSNNGSFVVSAQLVLDSDKQNLTLMYNRFTDNVILKGPGNLNPRSSVHAVVVLSTDNIVCQRNELTNAKSHYEIGTHLEASNKILNVSYNYWGNYAGNWQNAMKIVFGRIFGKTDRHTLANLIYDPLLIEDDLRTIYTTKVPAYRHIFLDTSVSPPVIGGPMPMKDEIRLSAGDYHVTRDIFVPVEKKLVLEPGVRLFFADSVGLFVQGVFIANGRANQRIQAHLMPQLAMTPLANGSSQEEIGVRLWRPGGSQNETEGRVEVFMKGRWGTVCRRGFTATEARVVCSQLGLVAHPDDWRLMDDKTVSYATYQNLPVWLSTVRCQPYDLDIRECDADRLNEHSCSHTQDVRIRCHTRGWAGIRLTTTRKISSVQHLNVTHAGLLDYFPMEYMPALMVDFNIHTIQNIDIRNSLSDGLRINYNHVWSESILTNSVFLNNIGSGIALRSPYYKITGCLMEHNSQSGFKYDPHFTEMESYQLRTFMAVSKHLMDYTGANAFISIQSTGYEFITVKAKTAPETKTYMIELKTLNLNERLIVTLVDFNPSWNEENVTFYNARKVDVNDNTPRWRVPEDLALFPIISSGQYITVKMQINGTRSNRLTMIVESKDLRTTTGAGSADYYPDTSLTVKDSTIRNNTNGITISHYNDPSDRNNDVYIRRKQENITLTNLQVLNNRKYAMHVPSVSRYARDLFAPSYSEIVEGSSRTAIINYTISRCNFEGNGGGILSDHNHVEYSNNVWHYQMTDNTIKQNGDNGFVIDLPFVSKRFDWRFEPDLNHVIYSHNNRFLDNKNFEFGIRGYFAEITLKKCRFENNICRRNLIVFEGMEKRMNIEENIVLRNKDCSSIVYINMNSQSEGANLAPATVTRNNFEYNTCPAGSQQANELMAVQPKCYTIGVFGLQNVTVQYNLFKNVYKRQLVAGMLSSLKNNIMDCRFNWWGSTNVETIRKMIFDSDDWNNYALVDFSSFLIAPQFNAMTSTANVTGIANIVPSVVLRTGILGGRIDTELILPWRSTPYQVTSDVTVTRSTGKLKIDAGVTLEFAPNIGILVFGKLIARGTIDRPITFRPMTKPASSRYRREIASSPSIKTRLIGGQIPNEGFLQFYNTSSGRWDMVCDRQFSERVGRVVCRELGINTYNVVVRDSYLYDYYVYGYENPYIAKHFWMRTYTCTGEELSRQQCTQRVNYDVYACAARRGYTFLRCGKSNLENVKDGSQPYGYWGNIRIASNILEQTGQEVQDKDTSFLEHVHFKGAGVLHGERVAAIETTYVYPKLDNIRIESSAWHGVDIIAPRGFVRVANSTFHNNLGRGFNLLVLNGDSSTNERTPFVPLKELSLPAHFVYGLLDMCDLNKDFIINDRILVYYKYTEQTRACTKMFRSRVQGKRVAVRFLQLNLYEDPFTKNSIELFNGENFNTTELLVELTASKVRTEDAMRKSYTTLTDYSIMGIHVHASPAGPMFGFLAELVTTPLSAKTYPDLKEEMTHSILDSVFTDNAGGAVGYGGVGELNPDLEVRTCRMLRNGLAILNLTSPATVDLQIQNARTFDFSNNYLYENRGGFASWLYASSGARAIRGNITNNVFVRTSHGIPMHLSGKHFNMLRVKKNFIANNDVGMRDIIRVSGVLMKSFEQNYVYKNRGNVILNVSGVDTLSEYSEYSWNGFYKNIAINYTRKTTVFCDSIKHRFRYNYFRNWENNFEMATGNMSIEKSEAIQIGGSCPGVNRYCPIGWTTRRELGRCVCYRRDPVDARYNWWGEGDLFYIRSRIFDQSDDDYLINVNYQNSFETNSTVLNGAIYCPPTWNYTNSKCFWYVGAYATHREAKQFCEYQANAILADSRRIVSWLTRMIEAWQNNYQWINRYVWVSRAWVFSDKPTPRQCAVLRNYWIEGYDCDRRVPFFCQKSPYGAISLIHVVAIAAVSVVFGIFLICGVLFAIFWYFKSKRRKVERQVYRTNARQQALSRSKASLIDPAAGSSARGTALTSVGSTLPGVQSNIMASQSFAGTLAGTVGRDRPDSAHPGMVLADSRDRLDRAQVDELRSNRPTVTGSRSTLVSKQPTGSVASLDAVDLIGTQKDFSQRQQDRPMYNPTAIPLEDTGHSRNRPTMSRPQPYRNRPHPPPYPGVPVSSSYNDDEFSSASSARKPSAGGVFRPDAPRGYTSLTGTASTTDSEFDTDFDDSESTVKKYPLPDSSTSSRATTSMRPPAYTPYKGYHSSETDV